MDAEGGWTRGTITPPPAHALADCLSERSWSSESGSRTSPPGVPTSDRRRFDLVLHRAYAQSSTLCCDAMLVSPIPGAGTPHAPSLQHIRKFHAAVANVSAPWLRRSGAVAWTRRWRGMLSTAPVLPSLPLNSFNPFCCHFLRVATDMTAERIGPNLAGPLERKFWSNPRCCRWSGPAKFGPSLSAVISDK